MTKEEMRAIHVAEQTNAKATEALARLYNAIRKGDIDQAERLLVELSMASFEAGWDQCYADITAMRE